MLVNSLDRVHKYNWTFEHVLHCVKIFLALLLDQLTIADDRFEASNYAVK